MNSSQVAVAVGSGGQGELDAEQVRRFCSPRFMPVRLPAPVGPKLFILGEPVLQRYYTVYDWANHRVGFSLANTRRNTMDPSEIADRRGVLPEEVDMLLMQEQAVVSRGSRSVGVEDEVALVQVFFTVTVRHQR